MKMNKFTPFFIADSHKHICGWAARFAGRNRTECTMEDRKAKQTAADQYFCSAKLAKNPCRNAADRPSESRQNCSRSRTI